MLIGSIAGTFVSFGIWICAGIYTIAAKIFQVFMLLAGNNVIDSSVYESLLNNVYLIIGVVMLFIIAFYLLQMMVNPDDSNKSRSSITKLIMNFITSLLIIILLPTIFGFLYDVQASIINNNTIGKFFNYDTDAEASETVNQAGARIANSIWLAFFNVNEEWCESNGYDVSTSSGIASCQTAVKSEQEIFSWNKITFTDAISSANNKINFYVYMRFAENTQDDESITFHFIFCLVAGLALAYVGISYCLDMGVRYVKLIFYQVIAPIPILLRMVPGGKMSESFNQWVKITLTCYFEVFVRILVLYFCVWICDVIIDGGLFTNATSSGWFVTTLAQACILMGIVAFMQQAPKLIGQMLGIDSGNMKLGIRDKLREGGAFVAASALGGAGIAAISNGVQKEGNLGTKFRSVIGGATSGFFRGARSGVGVNDFRGVAQSVNRTVEQTTGARIDRENRNNRYHANGQNFFTGLAADAYAAAQDYFSGGLDRYEPQEKGLKEIVDSMGQIDSGVDALYNRQTENSAFQQKYFDNLNAKLKDQIDTYDALAYDPSKSTYKIGDRTITATNRADWERAVNSFVASQTFESYDGQKLSFKDANEYEQYMEMKAKSNYQQVLNHTVLSDTAMGTKIAQYENKGFDRTATYTDMYGVMKQITNEDEFNAFMSELKMQKDSIARGSKKIVKRAVAADNANLDTIASSYGLDNTGTDANIIYQAMQDSQNAKTVLDENVRYLGEDGHRYQNGGYDELDDMKTLADRERATISAEKQRLAREKAQREQRHSGNDKK